MMNLLFQQQEKYFDNLSNNTCFMRSIHHQSMRQTPLIVCKGKLHKHLNRCYCTHKQAQQIISTVWSSWPCAEK